MNLNAESESELESESEIEDVPLLPSIPSLKRSSELASPIDSIHAMTDNQNEDLPLQNSKLMKKARGPLALVGPFLEQMEIDYSRTAAGFLALISEGVSQLPRRPIPPQGQSHEDRRVMIRLNPEYEVRKIEPLLLRQQLQRMIPDPTLVADAILVSSGVAILAPKPAKAATILQYKEDVAQRFGNAVAERQESWTTFVIDPLPIYISNIEGPQDPIDELLLQELGFALIRDEAPIRQMAWTKRSKESTEPLGHIRKHVSKTKVHKFPSSL
ncbi:hypothetical protein EV44_g4081 [Erysiphe necator]|uniref:Uncharacterized protein n=1 Tax=Uncinula necator TaxID=52586 RepID=A0A0B1P8Z7_UNCNE|nr:hypothetical protein EV44_g4081 [Erysiphe necator]